MHLKMSFVDILLRALVFQHPNRGVAQPGSAPALGAGSRRFKSSRPDQLNQRLAVNILNQLFPSAYRCKQDYCIDLQPA